MSSSGSNKGGGPPDERRPQRRGKLQLVPDNAEPPEPGIRSDPPPLGPLPPVGDDLAPTADDDLTDLDGSPTRPIRRMDLADLLPAPQEAPHPSGGLERHSDPGPGTLRPGGHPMDAPDDTEWNEPPRLPEPPVSFAPPEMTLPPRLPGESDADAARRRDSATDGSAFASALGTPELPEGTPSTDPLAWKLRQASPTADLVTNPGGRRDARPGTEFESAVISRVVDMSPEVMHLRPRANHASALTDSAWLTDSAVEPTAGTGETGHVTTVWPKGAPAPPPEQGRILGEAPASSPAPSAPGARDVIAGRYRVLERIGVGGMARIFRVQHLELGKDFALKIIHSALSEDTKVREMFYQEARLASSLDHPNIVLLTDFGVDDRYGAFIVMEYLKGETLHARLRREGRLHPNVACEVAQQVAEAAMFIHGRDVVHCDIKSENVFLCEPPAEARRRTIVKLLDFGLSRQKIGSGRVPVADVGGTPAYMAPERINRLSPRPSMDIYSLGILFYEMLTGTLPFVGTMEEVLIAQLHQPPESLSARTKDTVDDRLEELVLKALQKNPDRRQKDMGAFLYELRTVMDMLGIGRRRGKQPAERVRAGGTAARMKSCELLVAGCPLPLFMTDTRANLVLANRAFASFVNVELERVAGTRLMDTRLGRLCPEILADLRRVLATRKQAQRILSFPWRTAKQIDMMVWLTPEIVDNKVRGILGVIHPFNTTTTGQGFGSNRK